MSATCEACRGNRHVPAPGSAPNAWVVIPCRSCNSAAYERWAEGHYAKGHDPASCNDCRVAHGGKPSATIGSSRPRPPRGVDLDAERAAMLAADREARSRPVEPELPLDRFSRRADLD